MAKIGQKDAVATLFKDIAPGFKDRKGGYTRIIKLGPRQSDSAPIAFLEWVDFVVESEKPLAAKPEKAEKSAKAEKTEKPAKAEKAEKPKKEKAAKTRTRNSPKPACGHENGDPSRGITVFVFISCVLRQALDDRPGKRRYPDSMYTLDATGIFMEGDFNLSKLIPYEDIIEIKKISLAESVLTGMNLLKPGLCETYMGVQGDPLHVILIETKDGRYLVRGDDMDRFVAEANERLRAIRPS